MEFSFGVHWGEGEDYTGRWCNSKKKGEESVFFA